MKGKKEKKAAKVAQDLTETRRRKKAKPVIDEGTNPSNGWRAPEDAPDYDESEAPVSTIVVPSEEEAAAASDWRASQPTPETSVVVNGPALVEAKPRESGLKGRATVYSGNDKLCPICSAVIPKRYRICNDCLAKRQEARKAAKKPAATLALATAVPAQAQA
jgi:hypothetical protein